MIKDQQDHEWYVNIKLCKVEVNTSIMLYTQGCLTIKGRQSQIPLLLRHEKYIEREKAVYNWNFNVKFAILNKPTCKVKRSFQYVNDVYECSINIKNTHVQKNSVVFKTLVKEWKYPLRVRVLHSLNGICQELK